MRDATPPGTHRHKFTVNEDRTRRECSTCGAKQVKVRGKWQDERERTKRLPNGDTLHVHFVGTPKKGK